MPNEAEQPDQVFPGRFSNKVAVVTGAAQGIGYEVAKRLGLEGASVVIADAAEGPTHEAVENFKEMGIAAVGAVFDLSTAEGAEAALQSAGEAFGGVDVLVNNVGGTVWAKPFWHYSPEEISTEINRSFWPTMWCCRAAIDHLRKRDKGVIVNVGSNAAEAGIYRVPYSACKGAVISLTKSLAIELACFNIRVNCVSPGGTNIPERKTPRQSRPFDEQEAEWWSQLMKLAGGTELLPKLATPQEQAAVISFLASDDARHITGETIETGRFGVRIKDVLGFIP